MTAPRKRRSAARVQTPKELKALRRRLGLTQAQAAARIGVATRTWIAWENRQNVPSTAAATLIRLLSQGKL